MTDPTLASLEDDAIATVMDANGNRWRIENWSADDRSAYLGGEHTLPKHTKETE